MCPEINVLCLLGGCSSPEKGAADPSPPAPARPAPEERISAPGEALPPQQECTAPAYGGEALTEADLQLGPLRVRMDLEEVKGAMPFAPMEELTEHDGYLKRLVYADGTVVELLDGEVALITVTDPLYATPRGLKTGDTLGKLYALYGEPGHLDNGVFSYAIYGEYFLFHAVSREGIIVQLQVNLAC